MAAVEHDFEKSLVCIWVGGEVRGTGFVVAPGKVLTCAHVVCDKQGQGENLKYTRTKNPIEIEFYLEVAEWIDRNEQRPRQPRGKGEKAGPPSCKTGNETNQPRRVKARISKSGWSPVDKHDVAVLEFTDSMPTEVQPLMFSAGELKKGTDCHTRGFPLVGDTTSIFADDIKITAKSGTSDGKAALQIESNKINCGHSGAPLCEVHTGHVLGMVNAIAPVDLHGKLQNVAFAIPNSTLRRVVRCLQFAVPKGKRNRAAERVNQSYLRLWEMMRQCLTGSQRVREALANVVGDSQLSSSANVAGLIDTLVDPGTNRLAVISCLETLAEEFRTKQDLSGREAVNGLFAVFAPYCMDRKYAEGILAGLGVDSGTLLSLPWESLTLFEFVMAAMDGRAAQFDANSTEGVPKPAALLESLPEEGFSMNPDSDESPNLEKILEHVRQSIGKLAAPFTRRIHLEGNSTAMRLRELNDDLELMHTSHQTAFLNAATAKRQLGPREIEKIRKSLSYLALVDLVPSPSNADRHDAIRVLTSPIRSQKLLPLPRQDPLQP